MLQNILIGLLLFAFASSARAVTHYVAIASTNPVSPFITWDTAAKNIQDAIDVAVSNETVLVSNGVYETGTRLTPGYSTSNRVVITNSVIVRSVNGAMYTTIKGVLSGASQYAEVRCVYMSGGMLSGFTLTGGKAPYVAPYNATVSGGGGAYLAGGMLSDCTISSNSGMFGGGVNGGVLIGCVLTKNSGSAGGGAFQSGLIGCGINDNHAVTQGGGVWSCALSNCTLTGNSVDTSGGGAYISTLICCTLTSNSSGSSGGGSFLGTLTYCTLSGNTAVNGGGASGGTLTGCMLTENTAGGSGGGVANGTLVNSCTLVGNSASVAGGGSFSGTLKNCIVYSNTAPTAPNFSAGTISYSCTTPDPGGTGNIVADPRFAPGGTRNLRLLAISPCVDSGDNAAFTNAPIDLDGHQRFVGAKIDMGAFEFQGYPGWAGAITNGLTNLTDSATGDGYPNLLKYATGSSPTNRDNLAAMNETQTSNGFFALRFNRDPNANDVTLIAEGSYGATNGAPWNGLATNFNGSWGGATNVSESGTGTPVVVTVQDTTSQSGAATNRFLRLRVTRP